MLFSSLVFIWYFLPAVALVYLLAPGRRAKNVVLLAASLFFYSWGEPRYVVLVLLSILVTYASGLGLLAAKDQKQKKQAVVAVCVLINLGLLGYFKYFNFFAEIANKFVGHDWVAARDIALPIGISFYTFQALSYVIDAYRGEFPVQKNLFQLALYISLFPQILSGPIVKYREIGPQIAERTENVSMQAYGIKRFVYGLAKKVIFANTFGQMVDRMMAIPPEELGSAAVWFAVILYTLQIYYDFSGYSDMAIGLGRLFGFRYMENFNYPYVSSSISEFWRRWHISLSTWFKQYLYIPLGGNRKGLLRTCVNLSIVFLATGLWHGSSATFLCWGLYHGFFIVAERLGLKKVLDKNPIKALNHIYAMAVVVFGWLLFRVDSLKTAEVLLHSMLNPNQGLWNVRIFANNKVLFLAAVGILLCGPVQAVVPWFKDWMYDENSVRWYDVAIMAMLLFFSTMLLVSSTYNAFIYFRF